jgi:hypothetical protein
MSFQSRASRVALVEEVSEGVLVAPTVGDDFIPVLDGYTLETAIEELENAEIRASIGSAKSLTGLENPTGAIPFYPKASGVEATAPDHQLIYKSAFGATTAAFAEQTTTSGSTAGTAAARGVVKLAAGGSNFERGHCILLKDGTNGYSIRPVLSVATNDLTLGFNLSNAPATGVTVGRPILYKPANSGHPTLSYFDYRSNGGAVQAMAGSRVTELSWDISGGQIISANASLAGTSAYFNPVEITTSTNDIDFTDDGGAKSATISTTAVFYKDPHEAASALQTAMTTASANNITVSYSDSTGKFTTASDGSTFAVDWATTVDTLGAAFGYTADDTGALTYDSDAAYTLTSPASPSFDDIDPMIGKNHEFLIGGFNDLVCFEASSISFSLSDETADTLSVCAESAKLATTPTRRTVSYSIVGDLSAYDADLFNRLINNTDSQLMYAFGEKSGGNWVAGKVGCLYSPTMSITGHTLGDNNGLVTMNIEAKGFVDSSGNGEIYLNFL